MCVLDQICSISVYDGYAKKMPKTYFMVGQNSFNFLYIIKEIYLMKHILRRSVMYLLL